MAQPNEEYEYIRELLRDSMQERWQTLVDIMTRSSAEECLTILAMPVVFEGAVQVPVLELALHRQQPAERLLTELATIANKGAEQVVQQLQASVAARLRALFRNCARSAITRVGEITVREDDGLLAHRRHAFETRIRLGCEALDVSTQELLNDIAPLPRQADAPPTLPKAFMELLQRLPRTLTDPVEENVWHELAVCIERLCTPSITLQALQHTLEVWQPRLPLLSRALVDNNSDPFLNYLGILGWPEVTRSYFIECVTKTAAQGWNMNRQRIEKYAMAVLGLTMDCFPANVFQPHHGMNHHIAPNTALSSPNNADQRRCRLQQHELQQSQQDDESPRSSTPLSVARVLTLTDDEDDEQGRNSAAPNAGAAAGQPQPPHPQQPPRRLKLTVTFEVDGATNSVTSTEASLNVVHQSRNVKERVFSLTLPGGQPITAEQFEGHVAPTIPDIVKALLSVTKTLAREYGVPEPRE